MWALSSNIAARANLRAGAASVFRGEDNLEGGFRQDEHLAVATSAAVADVKDFIAGAKLTQKNVEKSVGAMTVMMSTICDAAGNDA